MILRAAIVPSDEAWEALRPLRRTLSALPGVTTTPPERLDIPVAGFGNLVDKDARRLVRELRAQLAELSPPVVRFSGVCADDGGEVSVGLAGDLERLTELARIVPKAAQSVRIFVDRRRFQPALVVGSVSQQAPGSRVDTVLGSLRGWASADWAVSGVTVIRTRWERGDAIGEEYDFVPLG